jgi:hypothetical protein
LLAEVALAKLVEAEVLGVIELRLELPEVEQALNLVYL